MFGILDIESFKDISAIGGMYDSQMHLVSCSTVNMVIFAGGKFRKNAGKTFHMGVIVTILLLFTS